MADEIPAHPIEEQSQSNLAREILDALADHRIDAIRLKARETDHQARSGRSVVTIAGVAVPEWSQVPESGFTVAVKKLLWDHEDAESSTRFFKAFVYELSLMKTLSHPNVIKLIGFVEDITTGDARIILPWEPNGNVREFLQSGEWDIPERVSLIQDTANGLEYLHTREPPICHGDLKSLHILVNSSFRAVITGFGSARIKGNDGPVNGDDQQADSKPRILGLTLEEPGFTLRWASPEVLDEGQRDLPSDMWALGWVCWEIVTGKIPYEELKNDVEVMKNIIKGILAPIREDPDLSHVLQLCNLMSECWIMDPDHRVDISTFCRRVRFLPSITPSSWVDASGRKIRSAGLLLELGRMYSLQYDTMRAEAHYQAAVDVAVRAKDDKTMANALIGLGEGYKAQSRYAEAEKAFAEARAILSRIGNDSGLERR